MFIVALAMLIACKKDDPKDPAPAPAAQTTNSCPGAMTLSIDGVNQTITGFNNSLIISEDGVLSSRRMDIRASIGSKTMFLTVSNMDWQNPPANGILAKTYNTDYTGADCREYDGINYCDGMLGTYIVNDSTFYSSGEESIPGYITITSIDGTNRKVSGNFSFKVIEAFQVDTLIVTGSFTNQCYTVYQ